MFIQTRIIQHAEELSLLVGKIGKKKQALSVAQTLQQELQQLIKNNTFLSEQNSLQKNLTHAATDRAVKAEATLNKLTEVTQKQSKIIIEYQSFIKTNIPIIIEKAEAVKNDVDILIVGLQTLNDHFNKILESLNDYQIKNRTIIANAQNTTNDLISTSQIMDSVAKDSVELQGKLPEFQNIISQISELSEKLAVIVINAGIQSAHAGEYGKTFAVIAQEIAKLNLNIQRELLPQQTAFIKDKITPTIALTTTNATAGSKKLHQNTTTLKEANELSHSVVESLDSMIEAIRDIKSTIESFMENLTGIQSNMDDLVNSIKGIKTIQAEIFNYQDKNTNPEKLAEELKPTTGALKPIATLATSPGTTNIEQTTKQKISPAQWIEHKGTRILYFDFSGHKDKEDEEIVLEKLHEAMQVYKTTKENNIRVISNVTDCINTPRVYEGFKALREAGKNRIAHSVLVGATGSKKAQAKILGWIVGKLTLVDTLEEAKEFHAAHRN